MKLLRAIVMVIVAYAIVGAAPAPARRGYVDGPWGQIHYRVQGRADQPTVILLHKMVWSSLEFEHVQPILAEMGVRSIAVDLPGYGLSDGPTSQPAAADYADALLPVLDQFGLTRANIAGIHTGATIAVAFADRHPDRVAKLVIAGPPLFDAKTLAALLAQPPADRGPQPGGAHFTRRWAQVQAAMPPHAMSDQAMHQSTMQFFVAGPREDYAHDAIFRFDLAGALKRLRGPVLLLTSQGDVLFGAAQQAHAMRPDFDYAQLDWPGVQVAYDHPRPWAEAVAAAVSPPAQTRQNAHASDIFRTAPEAAASPVRVGLRDASPR